MWPFSKRTTKDELPPEIEQQFVETYNLLNNDAALVSFYPASLQERMKVGANCDALPNGVGPFGYCMGNPIPINGPIGEVIYLSALRFNEERVLFHRLGSYRDVDLFECVSIDAKRWDIIFLDIYHPRQSRLAPNGYTITKNVLLSGINNKSELFPQSLYPKVVTFSKALVGFSIADPKARIAIESTDFARPPWHASRVSKIEAGNYLYDPEELVDQMCQEAIGCQTSIYDGVARFCEMGLDRREIQTIEICCLSVALAVHSIFQWSQISNKEQTSDKVTYRVLKLYVEAIGASALVNVVSLYRDRFNIYRSVLLQMEANKHQSDFINQLSILMSQNVLGKSSPLIGTVISSMIMNALDQMKQTIQHAECFEATLKNI